MQRKRFSNGGRSTTSWRPIVSSSSVARPSILPKRSCNADATICFVRSDTIKEDHSVATTDHEKSISVNVVITVPVQHQTVYGIFTSLGLDRYFGDFRSQTLLLDLVSSNLDPGKALFQFFLLLLFFFVHLPHISK